MNESLYILDIVAVNNYYLYKNLLFFILHDMRMDNILSFDLLTVS